MKRLISTLIPALLGFSASAATIYVDASGTGNYPTIQAAINAAGHNDIIIVHPGRYYEHLDTLGKAIKLTSTDPNDPNVVLNTIIDGNNAGTCVTFNSGEDANTILTGFLITRGKTDRGGGIFCDCDVEIQNCVINGNLAERRGGGMYCGTFSAPTITNCTFIENVAYFGQNQLSYGGGLSCFMSNATIVGCTFQNNSSDRGGGIDCDYQSNITLVDCSVIDNNIVGIACYGNSSITITGSSISDNSRGGIFFDDNDGESELIVTNSIFCNNSINGAVSCCENSTFELVKCFFINNGADSAGGALSLYKSHGELTNCYFLHNSASYSGGGLECYYSDLVLKNCVFSGNSAEQAGAVCGLDHSNLTISNCTFTGNRGAQFCGTMQIEQCNVTLGNCTFWSKKSIDMNDIVLGYSDVDVSYCNIQGGRSGVCELYNLTLNWGPGDIDSDPHFVDPGYWDPNGTPDDANDDFWLDGDYHLLPDSPCIDAGDPCYVAGPNEMDLDGLPRVEGGQIDMGAYEFRMPEFEVDLQINPRTLNAKSRGNFISAVLTLPPQLDAIDVSDEPLTLYPGEISSQNCRRSHNKITCKFDRRQLIAALPDDTDTIEIEVVGQLTNGSYFYGTDTLRIIHR